MKSMPMKDKAMDKDMKGMGGKGKSPMPECMMGRMIERHSPAQMSSRKVGTVMREFKAGTLHSGSATGPKVTKRKQAIAIAMSEQRKAAHGGY